MKESLVYEIAEQLCVASILKESKLQAANTLALLNIDSAVEDILKSYCIHQGFIREDEADSGEVFHSLLGKVKDQNKIIESEQNDIAYFHDIRHTLYKAKHPKIDDKTIEEYLISAKILLAHLFEFRAPKAEWEKITDAVRKAMIK